MEKEPNKVESETTAGDQAKASDSKIDLGVD